MAQANEHSTPPPPGSPGPLHTSASRKPLLTTVLCCHRKQQAEEAEKRRLAVEEEMEARRKVLMSDENGYWSKRMAQDAQTKARQEESIVHPGGSQVCFAAHTYWILCQFLMAAW